ncbi:MAG: ABC transporter ATP-binding protein [Lautropia sp.]|nr:ABC transporter ATP-binding protein [Lautropia sp.]
MDPVRGRIRVAMAIACLGSALSVLSLTLVAFTLHALLMNPSRWPTGWMLALSASTVGAYLMRLTAFRRSHYAAFRLEVILRMQLADHVARLSLGQIQAIGASQLAKVMHDDVRELHVFVADSTPMYARAVAAPILALATLLWLDWAMALVALAVPALGFAIMTVIIRGSQDMNDRYNAAREQVAAAVVEFVQAMPVVRTFDTGNTSFGRYQLALLAYLKVLKGWYASVRFSSRFSMFILSSLPTMALLLWVGSYWVVTGNLSFELLLASLLIGAGLAESMLPVMSLYHLIQKTRISVSRIQQILSLAPQTQVAGPGRQPADATVRFEGVSFRYDTGTTDVPALKDISFVAPAGSVTALVGPSGAGKSTVARLIPRFWDVCHGRISIGGVDVREMTTDTLMSQVAFVFQDSFLFAGSIAENIRLGSPKASMAEVEAAARAAQAHDFISALPQGYDTRAGERGSFLSGGQRQRITIARAMLQNRPILVLDEATAFADPENEAALVSALSALMQDKTVLLVAHRLATIQDADQILVFDRGHLVERGRHPALLAHGGVYARLWHSGEAARAWRLPAPDAPAPEGPAPAPDAHQAP